MFYRSIDLYFKVFFKLSIQYMLNLARARTRFYEYVGFRRDAWRGSRQIGNYIIVISYSLLFEFQLIVVLVNTQVTRWR